MKMTKYWKIKEETPFLALIRNKREKPLSRKKKTVLTDDSMVNGISEKGLSVNHTEKIV